MNLELISIISTDDTRIKYYLSMRDNIIDNNGLGLFVAEGEKVVLKLLNSNLRIHSIFARKNFYDKFSNLLSLRNGISYFVADEELLRQIIGFRMHTGVMAIASKPYDVGIDDLSEQIICLNGIVDSENIGSIIRNSSAFEFNSMICDKSTSSPFMRRAVRVSMGTVFNQNIYKSNNLENDLLYLKTKGYKIIAAEITENSVSLLNIIFPEKFVLIFGNEAQGISQNILNISDYVLHIPISNQIESLNVACTSAIFMTYIKHKIS